MIGLGKMGGNLARNMRDHGFEVVVYNHRKEKVDAFIEEGFKGAYTISSLADQLGPDGIYWMMIPAGEIVDSMIDQLRIAIPKGALIIDAGNSNYNDTISRAEGLLSEGFRYMDIGTSGGQQGARQGACMMIGGTLEDYQEVKPIVEAVCVPGGVNYIGKHGSGHYVKMIHNGIEYGMMQAIAEGFEILEASEFEVDLEKVGRVWKNGSIISSYLVDKTVDAISKNPTLDGILDVVDSSGEGLWTVEEALRLRLPSYVITASLFKRYESKQDNRFSNKLLAAMRNEFGGHKLHKVDE